MRSETLRIGFVGFGEAAFHIAKGLHERGAGPVAAYDINAHAPELGDRIQQRASESGTLLLNSNAELAESSEVILSTVTADQAAIAARQTAPYLNAHHIHADLNSVSPATKQSIAKIIGESGARFVEGAIMQYVPPYGHRVPMLAGGPYAAHFVELMSAYDMRIEIVGDEIGAAAATKMFRSIVIKGLEAIVTECVLAASRYNAVPAVFASLRETYPGINWSELADHVAERVVLHGDRRAREMEEVSETLRAIEIEPIMAEAIARRMDWSAGLGLKSMFNHEPPKNYIEVIHAIESKSKSGGLA